MIGSNSPNVPAVLVQQYIGTAYDVVKQVSDVIPDLQTVAAQINAGTDFTALATAFTNLGNSAEDLAALATANLTAIGDDLAKGSYLGSRKIDLDLSSNNTSGQPDTAYDYAVITKTDGLSVTLTFDASISDYSSIKAEIDSKIAAFNAGEVDTTKHIVNYSLIAVTQNNTVTSLRFVDSVASISNIVSVSLHSSDVNAVSALLLFSWSMFTSALEVVADNIDEILKVNSNSSLYLTLESNIPNFNTLIVNLIAIQSVVANLSAILDAPTQATAAANSASQAAATKVLVDAVHAQAISDTDAIKVQAVADTGALVTQAQTFATNASLSADEALASASLAQAKSNEIKTVTVGSTTTAVEGSLANVIYNPTTGQFHFIVPKGDKGDQGEAFQVDAVGLIANRSSYDNELDGFAFLAMDESKIYFKLTDNLGDWSLGAPFGKGDTGTSITSIAFLSTTDASGNPAQPGGTDTYQITFSNATTTTFAVYNGNDGVVTAATTEAIGLVEKATTLEATTGAENKFPDAAGVKAAIQAQGATTTTKGTVRKATGTEALDGIDDAYPDSNLVHIIVRNLTADVDLAGTVEKATSAEAIAGTVDKFPDAAGVKAHVDDRVTTGTNSAAAGKLQKVGDYGNGRLYPSASVANIDFHALPESVYFNGVSGKNGVFASGGSSNTPPKGSFWWIEVIMLEGGSCRMIATTHNAFGSSEERTVFFKDRVGGVGGVWSSWTEVITTASILGTVGWDAAGGIPSGAVMERGSNINGEYVKLADGTVINHVAYAQAYPAFTDFVYTLPHALITTANAGIALSVEPNSVFDTEAQAWLGTNTYLIFRSKTESVGQNTLRFTVIGRWR